MVGIACYQTDRCLAIDLQNGGPFQHIAQFIAVVIVAPCGDPWGHFRQAHHDFAVINPGQVGLEKHRSLDALRLAMGGLAREQAQGQCLQRR